MYTLVKNNDFSYHIVVGDQSVGIVIVEDKEWTAAIGKIVFASPRRKNAVENVLHQIIMLYANKEHKEKIETTL